MPRITIIETGLVSPKNRELHGSYPQMFEHMIGAADATVTFNTVSIPAGEPLPDVEGLEAILITGSSAGVYDAFEWIAPLEEFVRTAHDKKVPMVGVCFGHQLIAQALGGTVRKSEKGWGLGRHVYDVAPSQWPDRGRAYRARLLAPGPGHHAAGGRQDDPVLGFHAACRAALRRRQHAFGAATPGILRRLRAGLLRDGAQQGPCAR